MPAADGKTSTVDYAEKLNIGYRWYDANISKECPIDATTHKNDCVAFPFGYGLSYTSFTVTHPNVVKKGNVYQVKATVKNTGSRTGSEVVQVFISLPAEADSVGTKQPPKRLVGFQKVELSPHASKSIVMTIDPSASNHPLSVWSTADNKWVTFNGEYTVSVGNSSSPSDLKVVTFTQ